MEPTCVVKEYSKLESELSMQEFEEQREYSGKWDQPVVTYSVIRGTEDIKGDERLALNLAMTTWDIEVDISLKWVPYDTNPDITVKFVPAKDDDFFRNRPSILAYAFFPATRKEGVIVFNDDYVWTMHGKSITGTEYERITGKRVEHPENMFRTFNVIHTLIHEIGHSLGLRHDEHNDSRDVMDPFYNGMLELSDWDLLRIRQKYPIRMWNRWFRYARIKRWLARRKVRF